MSTKLSGDDIKRAIRSSVPLVIKSHTLPHETETYMVKILEKFLEFLGRKDISSAISYCIRELAVNAKKANTKRVYFKEKNLDITNPGDYTEGMKTFKKETLSNIKFYLEKQKEYGYYIKIIFHANSKHFRISIANNVEMTKKEQIRVFDRIARARAFDTIAEAFSAVLDDSEGAGLGIVVMIQMLKQIGLGEDIFEIDVRNGETVTRITIPLAQVNVKKLEALSTEIVREVKSLPQFPENLIYLQKLISDPESKINEISRQVSSDPSLTAELLKLVNSPIYMVAKKVENISEAIKLVGMKGLRNLLYSYGSQMILGKKYKEMKQLWNHSYKVAVYAYNIAKNFRKMDIIDDVFVGGILHDLGKIIFSSLHPNLLTKIQKFGTDKGIASDMLENIAGGMNHAEIGALIAEKWNFPDQLVASIKWHHEVNLADKRFMDVVYPVYFANFIVNMENEIISFDQVDINVLRYYKIVTEEQLLKLAELLSKKYNQESQHSTNVK
ncbi:MAG: HDOD domain-containing protein [Spirochaetales bacterium]|nr:HDOD domain-containing protein [Spirochaetales bacterium]